MRKSGYRATEILPPGSTSADLQEAINRAAHEDVIQISGDMPFTDTVAVPWLLEITIRSDAGNNWVMSQTNSNTRHFAIDGSLILENITLDGGNSGGGVQLNRGAFALLDGAVIQNCLAVNGGGVQVIAGVFSIYGGTIQNNKAQKGGGVHFTIGTFNMSASTGFIKNNTAIENGGGIYIENGYTLSLSGGEISGNEAVNGGGLYLNSGSFTMSRGAFSDNKATANGGGVYVATLGTLAISGTNSSIINNDAANGGGGIYTQDTTYGNLTTDSNLIFRCNKALAAYTPPAAALYPNIQFASVTITNHPLNNFDINYTDGEPAAGVYNVTYNANGGGGSYIGPDILPCGTDTVLSDEDAGISREEYTFTGWNTQAGGGGSSYVPGDSINLMNNVTLYAQWTVNLYTVNYEANGGSGTYADTDISSGTAYTVLAVTETQISYEGHTFNGWNTEPDGKGTSCAPGEVTTVTGDIILYAQWTVNLYTVNYEANGGSGECKGTDIPYETEYTVLTCDEAQISYAGHIFTGWNTEPDGSGISHAAGDVITIIGNISLYAQWKSTPYKAIYGANCGNGGYADTDIPHGTGYTVLTPDETEISRKGHAFTGWNTEPDGSGTSHASGDAIILTDDIILYAQWTPNLYAVIYKANSGKGGHMDTNIPYGTEYTVLTTYEAAIRRKGYAFTGWNTEPDGSGVSYAPGDVIILTDNIILYAQWEPNLYTVVYKANCGKGGHRDTDIPCGTEYTVLTVYEARIRRKDYAFTDWNTEPDGTGTCYAPCDVITLTGNIILYAQWRANDKLC